MRKEEDFVDVLNHRKNPTLYRPHFDHGIRIGTQLLRKYYYVKVSFKSYYKCGFQHLTLYGGVDPEERGRGQNMKKYLLLFQVPFIQNLIKIGS
mgnify:CR=1 FL=1